MLGGRQCAGTQDFRDVLDVVNSDTAFQSLRLLVNANRAVPLAQDRRYIPDWPHFIFKLREKLAQPYSFQEELDIHDMLSEWREFAKELSTLVQESYEEVEKCLQGVSSQREQTFAVSGRLLWGTLTLFVPPPVGVLLGAMIYAATEDNLRGGVQKFVEWGMQTPQPYGPPGQLAPRAERNINPSSLNSGGQEKIRDLKDINMMIKSVEKVFGGERGKWLKELNHTTLRQLLHVPDLSLGTGNALDLLVKQVCDSGQEFLKKALVREMTHLVNDDLKLRRIAEVVAAQQIDVLDGPNGPEGVKPKSLIREGVILFLNRLAHEQVQIVKNARGAERVPLLREHPSKKAELKRRFQSLVFAYYFNKHQEGYAAPGHPAGTWLPRLPFMQTAQPSAIAAMYGVVPNSLFSSSYAGTALNSMLVSPLEEKLTKLGIIERGTQADITRWGLPHDLHRPVPYTTIDSAFRGRLRAWAAFYCGDTKAVTERRNEITDIVFSRKSPALLAMR
jgi:hypothetical protein